MTKYKLGNYFIKKNLLEVDQNVIYKLGKVSKEKLRSFLYIASRED